MTVPAGPEMTSEILIGRGFPDPFLPRRTYRRTAAIFSQQGAAAVARRVFDALGTAPIMYVPDRDEAKTMAVVEKAFEERQPWLGQLKVDPQFEPLRSDPRFGQLIRRVEETGARERLSNAA